MRPPHCLYPFPGNRPGIKGIHFGDVAEQMGMTSVAPFFDGYEIKITGIRVWLWESTRI
jgi:hypothetical protein